MNPLIWWVGWMAIYFACVSVMLGLDDPENY